MAKGKKASKRSGKSPKIVKKKLFNLKLPKFGLPKFKKINRDAVLAGSLAAILVLVGLFALLSSGSSTEKNDEVTIDEVVEIKTAPSMLASVTLQEGIADYKVDLEDWESVPKDLAILPGMSLRTTGAASRVVVTLEDGSAVRLDANTKITFETLTTARVVILQESGHVFSRVAENVERTYVVHTENSQFQANGTSFRTNAGGDEESVDVFQHSVGETRSNLKADEGEKLIIKRPSEPTKNETVERLDIEELKQDSFILWNIERDKEDERYKDNLGYLSDTEGPEVKILSPAPSSTIDVDTSATEGTVEIEGTTEKGAKLTVRSKSVTGSTTIDVAVTSNGSFKTPVLPGVIGQSVYEFIARDGTGNETTLNVSYIFKKKNVVQEQGIALTLDDSDENKLVFSWGLVGITTPDGVQLIYAEDDIPTYPEDNSKEVSSGSTVEFSTSKLDSGKTYKFRVCRYSSSGDSCDIYSNTITFEKP